MEGPNLHFVRLRDPCLEVLKRPKDLLPRRRRAVRSDDDARVRDRASRRSAHWLPQAGTTRPSERSRSSGRLAPSPPAAGRRRRSPASSAARSRNACGNRSHFPAERDSRMTRGASRLCTDALHGRPLDAVSAASSSSSCVRGRSPDSSTSGRCRGRERIRSSTRRAGGGAAGGRDHVRPPAALGGLRPKSKEVDEQVDAGWNVQLLPELRRLRADGSPFRRARRAARDGVPRDVRHHVCRGRVVALSPAHRDRPCPRARRPRRSPLLRDSTR